MPYYVVIVRTKEYSRYVDSLLRLNDTETSLCEFDDYEDAENIKCAFEEKTNLTEYEIEVEEY